MSKHLRGQRRQGGRPDTANLHKEPVMDANELKLGTAQDAQPGAPADAPSPEEAAAQQAAAQPEAKAQPRPFSAQDLSQPDIGMGDGGLGGADDGAPFPNGDDPDRVPVTPELPDDKVPNMPGAILKHAREMLGLSMREVALRLQVRVNTVSDIEHDRLNQQTAVPFATAYLTAYAKLVNVDPAAVVSLYRQNVSRAAVAAASAPQARQGRRGGFLARAALLVLIAAAVLAAGIAIGVRLAGGGEEGEGGSGALTISPSAQE
ncbi:MAG: helix-turn-helix domain-containing protein, partial [Succinivibrio sp.]